MTLLPIGDRLRGYALIGAVLGLCAVAHAGEPLRLADGRPFVAVYYFGHWWEPWRSDDGVVRADLARLREMGVSVLGLDHEWSQAIDGDWRWLDREHRLAKEAGLEIVPWLSLKVWSDLSGEDRMALMGEWYGVHLRRGEKQDRSPGPVEIWDEGTIRAGAAYAAAYLDRYEDQALLHVNWGDVSRPVVALSVELAWEGGFDTRTTERFREWLLQLRGTIEQVNAAWATDYARLEDVDPRDTHVFDYAGLQAGTAEHAQAVEDHIEFRSQMISDSLARQAALLREKHPDVLILAELPYQFASRHPHAESYRTTYATNPSCARSADILWFRCTGPLSQEEGDFLARWREATGQPAVLTFRTYSDWAHARSASECERDAGLLPEQAVTWGSGFGFYSWNEMGDTHAAPSPPAEWGKPGALTPAESDRAAELMAAMVRRYLGSL